MLSGTSTFFLPSHRLGAGPRAAPWDQPQLEEVSDPAEAGGKPHGSKYPPSLRPSSKSTHGEAAERLWVGGRYRRCCCPWVQRQPACSLHPFVSHVSPPWRTEPGCYGCLWAPPYCGSTFPLWRGFSQPPIWCLSVDSFCKRNLAFLVHSFGFLSFRKPHVSRLGCNCYLAIGYQIPTDIYASGFFCAICASSRELLENPTFKQIYPSLCNI